MSELHYQRAVYLTAAAALSGLPPDQGVEVAFAGRSNAGKSSAINTICRHTGLARTSKTPGRTRLLQLFSLDPEHRHRLVDLPGYGYADVPAEIKAQWARLIEGYLRSRRCLKGLVLLVDIRHPLKPSDWQMLQWAESFGMPVQLLLTKADKLGRGAAARRLQEVRAELRRAGLSAATQLFSALQRQGVEEAVACLDRWYGWDEPTTAEPPADGSGTVE